MCFRPADAGGGAHKCPECGKTIQAMGGMKLTKCPFCKCDLTPYINGEKPDPADSARVPRGSWRTRCPRGTRRPEASGGELVFARSARHSVP